MSPTLWAAIVNQVVNILFLAIFVVGGGWLLKSSLGKKLHGFKIPGIWPPAQTSPLAAAGETAPFYGCASYVSGAGLKEYARGWITRDGLLWRVSPTRNLDIEHVSYLPVNLVLVERLPIA